MSLARLRSIRNASLLSLLVMVAMTLGIRHATAAAPGTTDGGTTRGQALGFQSVRAAFSGGEDCLRLAAAGVVVRNASAPTTGGTITLPAGPTATNIVWAGLYWVTLGGAPPVSPVTLNGNPVAPVDLGISSSPCWNQPFAYPYFADVTALVVPGANVVAGMDDSALPGIGYETEGASLVVVYRDPNSSACEIIVTDGNILMPPAAAVPLPVSCGPGIFSSLWFIGGDGQDLAPDQQKWNGLVVGDGDDFDNSDPKAPGASLNAGWDTDRWGVLTGGANLASVDNLQDCINWVATVIEVGVHPTNLCNPTPTRRSSWGGIKIRYR